METEQDLEHAELEGSTGAEAEGGERPPVFARPPSSGRADEGVADREESEAAEAPPQFLKRTAAAVEEEPEDDPVADSPLPRQPRSLADLGLSKAFLTDLALKIMHYSGTPTTSQLLRRLGVGQTVMQQLLDMLREERYVEVLSQSDLYTGNYRYRLSERGDQRVSEALERTRYAGPIPVTAEQYGEALKRHLSQRQAPSRGRIKDILNELVYDPDVADSVARALYSGKPAMLYGPSGNGKTSILERFARNLDGVGLVPYAIYAYGQVIRVFDQSVHEPLEDLDAGSGKDESKMDRRWVLVRRPAVVLGAEMGPESLDLAYDPQSRFYQAPPHIKAQGGILIIDDFGRQKIEARDLLTRWLIPLERGWDTLSLATGEKVTLPFSAQFLFATNLPMRSLADDSLLRRILYKVEIPSPRAEDFGEILRQMCRQKRVLVADGILPYVVEQLYGRPGFKPHASHARDLLDMIMEGAAFDGRDPVLDRESLDRILRMFIAQQSDGEAGS